MRRALLVMFALSATAMAGERTLVKLQDCCETEVKFAGFDLKSAAKIHIRALGGGEEKGWTSKSDRLFAYGWIIDADTREPVWVMSAGNTSRAKENREFDGTVSLPAGGYEVYFAAHGFAHHTAFSNITINIDRREEYPLAGLRRKKNFLSWFLGWWTDDIADVWKDLCDNWGLEILVDEGTPVSLFTPPREMQGTVLREAGLGDGRFVRQGFTLGAPTSVRIYALGEGRDEHSLVDFGWIVRANDRERVWDMHTARLRPGGGADKNHRFDGEVRLEKGTYVLYYSTDDSHSPDDWNSQPPYDPLRWGVTLAITDPNERKNFSLTPYDEMKNEIVSIVKAGDSEYLTKGFTLTRDTRVRVYAFGEQNNNRRSMADYGSIMDARTRHVVWSMDVDRTQHAGGAQKNRMLDEVILLRKGSYIVTYVTDDSHSYGDWNMDPPFDQPHYGITLMGVDGDFRPDAVAPYIEERDKNVVSQITRVRDDASRTERFSVARMTRVRVYALGEGQGRNMYDYGWIENGTTGAVVWEMTYSMTFHAGGGRKNRMVNTTLLLEPGEYRLRYKSDDSHSYGDWNVDPPEDQQYWGITIYRDEMPEAPPAPPAVPSPEAPPAPKRSQAP